MQEGRRDGEEDATTGDSLPSVKGEMMNRISRLWARVEADREDWKAITNELFTRVRQLECSHEKAAPVKEFVQAWHDTHGWLPVCEYRQVCPDCKKVLHTFATRAEYLEAKRKHMERCCAKDIEAVKRELAEIERNDD